MKDETEAADRFNQLDPKVRRMISRWEPKNAETLDYLANIPKEELQGMMKMFRDGKAVSKFLRWLIVGIIAIFLTTVAVGENILKVIAWIRGPS